MRKVSLELTLTALKRLGLTDTDARVYVYLAKKGPRGENDLANSLKLTKRQLSLTLESLLTKGMVSVISERSPKYSAIALEKALDQLTKERKKQVKALLASKEEMLINWRSMIEAESGRTESVPKS
jgi:sugar-specific transcriptional regulator TrmB